MNEENRERKMDNWIKVVTWLVTELYDFLSWFTGGFDGQLRAMTMLIVCDWITSILTAVIKRKWSLKEGINEILRKIFIFVLVGIANAIDTQIIPNNSAIRSAVILFYLTNEGVKCLKNAAAAGIPVPEKLKEFLMKMEKKISF